MCWFFCCCSSYVIFVWLFLCIYFFHFLLFIWIFLPYIMLSFVKLNSIAVGLSNHDELLTMCTYLKCLFHTVHARTLFSFWMNVPTLFRNKCTHLDGSTLRVFDATMQTIAIRHSVWAFNDQSSMHTHSIGQPITYTVISWPALLTHYECTLLNYY